MSTRHTPETPHPYAQELRYERDDMQDEMRAEQGCVGDECDGCPQCWAPEIDQPGEQQ